MASFASIRTGGTRKPPGPKCRSKHCPASLPSDTTAGACKPPRPKEKRAKVSDYNGQYLKAQMFNKKHIISNKALDGFFTISKFSLIVEGRRGKTDVGDHLSWIE